jgi:S-DNA-T family DNA segregation ATPase FtsK/SpoIIIE
MFSKKKDIASRELVCAQETHYKREILAVGLAMVFLFLAVAVFSYNSHDSTLFHYSSKNTTVHNWSGIAGANIAAFFFYLFGAAAYAFLLALLFPLYLMFFKIPFKREWGRLSIAFVISFILATLAAQYRFYMIRGLEGGVLGNACKNVMVMLTGPVGSQVLLWGILWICVSIFARVPLIPLFMGGLRWCKTGIQKGWAFVVRQLKRLKPQKKIEPVVAATKVEDIDTGFWQNVLGTTIENNRNVADATTELDLLSDEQQLRLAAIPLRRQSGSKKVLKTSLVMLPNSVLTYHLFVTREHGKNTYALFIQALNDNEQQSDEFRLPETTIFKQPSAKKVEEDLHEQMLKRAQKVEEKLQHFGVKGSVVSIKPGPVVTMFEYKPEIDSKISKILALEDDLAMALTAQSMRILAPIPGRNVVGFEISNEQRDDVLISQIVLHETFEKTTATLPIVLGVDIAGNPLIADLASMPHLLVGGATGSGKSVGLNTILVSLLCKRTPDEMKLILVDPKRLEFTPYAHIPHLLFPIVTQPTRAAAALAWVVQEMEQRYEAMASAGVRSIAEYMKIAAEKDKKPLPYIVVIIDELADLMMVSGKEVEAHLVRLAQMARAAGIHLIVATQRPSVDVVTGLIKVNFPSRIAFRVSSKVDSRTILDSQGAERLLGRGDMLFMHASSPELKRIHGCYVSDSEINAVANCLRDQRTAEYLDLNDIMVRNPLLAQDSLEDDLYEQVRDFIKTMDEISISMIQRHYRIGFNRSARLIEKLELEGLIAPAQGSKPRKVLR